ncbi:DUF1853 family protein [Oceanisphaera psychrotolerans]|uniref:DUF1853 family protein n=1 Tax=Oceanisphaera psychrotolerans TaxID=1414654 RepID=UPI003CCC42BF
MVDGTTLGAFDFIVWDRASQRIEHWELAVKFYLISDPGAPMVTAVASTLATNYDTRSSTCSTISSGSASTPPSVNGSVS